MRGRNAAAAGSPRLRQLVRRGGAPAGEGAEAAAERCDLCDEPLPAEHRHLLDLDRRELRCACRACALLFDREAAGGGHYRLVPQRRLRLAGLELADVTWERLQIPVGIAFFFRNSREGRVMAYYPSPMGPTESLLELRAWEEVERANPVLETMAADVEALLVDRSRGARRQWLVPIEDCYSLVGLIRTRWRGFTGGREAWEAIDAFFDELDRQATTTEDPPAATAHASGPGSGKEK